MVITFIRGASIGESITILSINLSSLRCNVLVRQKRRKKKEEIHDINRREVGKKGEKEETARRG